MPATPSLGVVLGSGLGGFADELTDAIEIPYAEIPGWPQFDRGGTCGQAGVRHAGRRANLAVLSGRAHSVRGLLARAV